MKRKVCQGILSIGNLMNELRMFNVEVKCEKFMENEFSQLVEE